jgi:hypothetical protein
MASGLIGVMFASALTAVVTVPSAMRDLSDHEHKSVEKVGLFDWLFGGSQTPSAEPPPRKREPDSSDGEERRTRSRSNQAAASTYRTLCVRLCDGFYFPISYATQRSKLREDADRCERQCPARSKLYFHRNPGEAVDDMVDLDGRPYTELAQAFRFREAYVADCNCHGNPWDADAKARHEEYASNPATAHPTPTVATAKPPKATSTSPQRRQTYWGYRSPRTETDGD